MVQRKLQNCSICTLSSVSLRTGTVNRSPYNTTKGAIVSLTKSMAMELAQYNIRCNTVIPGSIRTEMVMKNRTPEELQQRVQASVPLCRVGEPEEVANLLLFLASAESSYMTGQAVEITGGM
ncbi:(3R)-3-hydroxyacyl-CoA dehydrogenase-like [Branchiostoma lanceolatum]|uniref:(3R)-3-hydroxyacyl-CoA dehydrogenase-like n=1 Tax=Branchiostoma lanceolatum TaxID=7740 RepID=UPI003451EB99